MLCVIRTVTPIPLTMKRTAIILFLALFSVLQSRAQVFSFDMVQRNMNIDVRLTLKDAKTSEPISWASVYLIPQNDTTITHFALSDENGDVELKEVPVGKYELNAEMIGYLPHRKVYTFKNWHEDLGIIKMEENTEYLDAATVTAAGNAVMIQQDTIIFNASSFKVGENAMLADLLKKMPGIEVGEDGTVTVNGEEVDKITVGGKTFFFDDPTAALSNLPAKIVDRIKVVDKDKDEAEFSGIATSDDKEKVMDVELKEEYTKGWFGNARLGGGATLNPKSGDALVDSRGLLYNGNAMATGYTEKDQVVFIGNAYNAIEPGAQTFRVYYAGDDDESGFSNMEGLNSAAQAGINYSTDRIRGFSTTASVNYKNNAKVAVSRSARTSYQSDSQDILTDRTFEGTGSGNSVTASFELEKEDTKKYMLYFMPNFRFSDNLTSTSDTSGTHTGTVDASEILNTSRSDIYSRSRNFSTSGWGGFGIKDLGKERRSITLDIEYSYIHGNGTKHEYTLLTADGNPTLKDLDYDNHSGNTSIGGRLSYVEPIGKKWAIQAQVSSIYRGRRSEQAAFNPDGSANSYYSSVSDNRVLQEGGRLLMQYSNDTLDVQFGAMADCINNETYARSLDIETTTGKDEWLVNIAPFATLRYRKDSHNFNVNYSGYTRQVSASQLTPVLDIANPVQITAGNIYLQPSFMHYMNSGYSVNNRETFSFFSIYLNGTMTTNSIVYASWFDEAGVRYAVPVNSRKPEASLSLYTSYNRPIGKERRFTFSASGSGYITSGTSWQARSRTESLDIQTFDYNEFMSGFWGDASGSRFYSGESGFGESRTTTYNWQVNASLKYSIEKLDATLSASTSNRISRYSLDPSANMNTWSNSVALDLIYSPGKNWEIKSDLTYRFYHGYSAGYGRPEWNWNMGISKSIKSVTLSLKAADILNQKRSLSRTVSAEYMEDTYTNVLGRYFLFSVAFNFGKMNSKKNSQVESAMWRGMW